jgi:hypothetical protein
MYHGGVVGEVFTFTPYLNLEGGGRGSLARGRGRRWIIRR